MRTVNSLVKHRPVVLKHNKTIRAAASAMEENRIGSVLVANKGGDCVGILTDRDLMYGLMTGEFNFDTPVEELMTEEPVFVSPNCSINDAINKMKSYSIRRLPIGDTSAGSLRITGIITLDDLISARAISMTDAAQIIKSQRMGPPRTRSIARDRDQRREQTHARFIKEFQADAGLDRVSAEAVTVTILSNLCHRITPDEAADLCAQLPGNLKRALVDLRFGPDPSVTADVMMRDVSRVLGDRDYDIEGLVRVFFRFLKRHVSEGEIKDVMAQLPKDWRRLFAEDTDESFRRTETDSRGIEDEGTDFFLH